MKVRFTLDTGDHITLELQDAIQLFTQVDQHRWLWVDGVGVNLARVTKLQRVVGTGLVDFSV